MSRSLSLPVARKTSSAVFRMLVKEERKRISSRSFEFDAFDSTHMKDRGSDWFESRFRVSLESWGQVGRFTCSSVDPVPETAEQRGLVLDFLDEGRDVLDRSDLDEHSDDGLVGSSMSRSVERRAGGAVELRGKRSAQVRKDESSEVNPKEEGSSNSRNDRVRVNSRRSDLKRTGSRSVHLVVGVKDEEGVERFGQNGRRRVVLQNAARMNQRGDLVEKRPGRDKRVLTASLR